MTGFYSSPMGSYYRNQMNNLSGGYNYIPPYQNVPPVGVQQPINQFPCRAVGSIEEARGAILDNLTIPYVFTNFPNNEIYVKYTDNSTGQAKTVIFVPKPEDIKPMENKTDSLKSRVDSLEENFKMLNNELVKIKGGLNVSTTTDELISDDKNGTKSNGRNAKNVRE